MGNIDLEAAARKSIQKSVKIKKAALGFNFIKSDEITLPDSEYTADSNVNDFSTVNEYEKLNFIVQDEEQDLQSDYDQILHKYKDQTSYLVLYFLEVYQSAPKRQLVKIAQAIYQNLHNDFDLDIDDFKIDLVHGIYIITQHSNLILRLILILVSNIIIHSSEKYDERTYVNKSNNYFPDFFQVTNDLVISKKIALSYNYYVENIDRCKISAPVVDKLLENINDNYVRNFSYNLLMSNKLSSILDSILLVQDATMNDFKVQLVVYCCSILNSKSNKDK